MVHKRKNHEERCRITLEGMIKMRKSYFTVESAIEQEKISFTKMSMMAESTPLEDIETGKNEKQVLSLKRRF